MLFDTAAVLNYQIAVVLAQEYSHPYPVLLLLVLLLAFDWSNQAPHFLEFSAFVLLTAEVFVLDLARAAMWGERSLVAAHANVTAVMRQEAAGVPVANQSRAAVIVSSLVIVSIVDDYQCL